MDLVVEDYDDDDDAEAIGLTVARIRTLAESRLRAARLYDADAPTWLYVNVNVEARGFSLSVEYKKLLYDAVSGETSYATTGGYWRRRVAWRGCGFHPARSVRVSRRLHPGLPTRERVGV